jgi:L-asparaginase
MKRIIIHGGCGAIEDKNTSFETYHKHLVAIVETAYTMLEKTNNAIECAIFAANLLEDDTVFNAGTGSKVQQDGQIRMSASYMDSIKNRFAGVINIQNIRYPSQVAYALSKEKHTVLASGCATRFAQQHLNMPQHNPLTENRWLEYLENKPGTTGTIGVVVLDDHGVICAITSTGGIGYETPGRVGDSPTVAGNYASSLMGISCTGIGEEIINKAIATKIHTRVLDGMSLSDSINKTIAESDLDHEYIGLIALDKFGNIYSGSTKVAQTLYAYHDGTKHNTFFSERKML